MGPRNAMDLIHRINLQVAQSRVGEYFRLENSGHIRERKGSRFFTEIRAGLATFFAMAYILSVNANIVSQTGGTCVCPPEGKHDLCDSNVEYMLCVQEIRRDLVTATAAISALTSFCMGLFANMPIALAPGMGMNAFFTFSVVGYHGSGPLPYELALTVVFVEGLVFVGLTIFGLRQWLARAMPLCIKQGICPGIGLYLTVIGLTYSSGIGLITGARKTPTEIAGCKPEYLDPNTGLCPSAQKMRSPTMWIGVFCGGMLTAFLMMFRVRGAIIIGILLVAIISWPRGTAVTYFPYTQVGEEAFDFFKQVVAFHPIKHTLNALQWDIAGYGTEFGVMFITFLYVAVLDATAVLYSMARFCEIVDPVTQDFEGSAVAFLVDAFAISFSSLFGLTPVTTFIESGAGISEGGKTGLTAITSGLCFFISVFFAPIFASIPPWATGCTLVVVGVLMASSCKDINWRYMGDAVPAFLTIAVMPFTYSVAYGLIAGICSYLLLNSLAWTIDKASGGRIAPPDLNQKDPWTWKFEGGVLPPWLLRAAQGKKDFWREYDAERGNSDSSEPSGPAGAKAAEVCVASAEGHGLNGQ
ncbi:permease family-domain-containing protein [Phyllosticta citricarpa]|uniref:Permease family-domain-containing protein n=2 Tax=Phyllosticta TaxID=121621 RepID=A0ABR1MNA2_9PEZI